MTLSMEKHGESHAKKKLSVRCGERRKRQVSAARGYGSSDRASGHTGSAATTAPPGRRGNRAEGLGSVKPKTQRKEEN